MNTTELKNAIIPALASYCGVPIFMADQTGDKPDGSYATYKVTTPYAKGVGRAEETYKQTATGFQIQKDETYLTTFSFTAYAMDDDVSVDLAQKIYDWFAFFGSETLNGIGVSISEQTTVTNRDAFIVENYERRNGFDVIFRVVRKQIMDVDWFDKTEVNGVVISGTI